MSWRGIKIETFFRRIIYGLYGMAIILSLLSLTSYLNVGALTNGSRGGAAWANPGPLYPAFIIFMLVGMLSIIFPFVVRLRKTSERIRKQMIYILVALGIGSLGLGLFFVSFISVNMPWLYFPLQIIVGFIFAYAIFQHDLITVSIAFRRMVLFIGLYALVGTVLGSILVWFIDQFIPNASMRMGDLLMLLFIILAIASLGPWIYTSIVESMALFRERSTIELTHEFKTPLSAIQNAQEILDRELAQPLPDPIKVQDYMNMIQRNTRRLEKFVMDILNVGKAGESSREIQRQNVDIRTLLQNIAAYFPDATNRIQIVEGTTGNNEMVMGDHEALQQTFTNLIANAMASGTQAPVKISIQRKQDEIQVVIRDEGKGILKEDLERIFQPFVRSKHGSHAKSTGLGLTIAERWVRAHNGRIWAESEGLNKGAAFFVVLPIQ